MAAYVTLAGAVITILINWLLIPHWGVYGLRYREFRVLRLHDGDQLQAGQKYYPVPYAWKKLTAYVVICLILFGIHQLFLRFSPASGSPTPSGSWKYWPSCTLCTAWKKRNSTNSFPARTNG